MKSELKQNEKIIVILMFGNSSDRMKQVRECWLKYKTSFYESIRKHGKAYTLKTYKDAYSFLSRHFMGLNPKPLSFSKVDKRGIPKILWPLRPLIIRGELRDIKVLMCITRIYQLIRLPIDYDLSKITDPGVEIPQGYIDDFSKFTENWVRRLNLKKLIIKTMSKCMNTMKAGPNGHALVYAHYDILALALQTEKKVLKAIGSLNDLLGNSWINRMMAQNFVEGIDKPVKHSKLGFSAEGGGKTRIFAIGDYWSQMTLTPIHRTLYGILRGLETDGTYDQTGSFKRILRESIGKPTFCFDLSGASDRIPLKVQSIMMAKLFGEEISKEWTTIIADREFHSPVGEVRWKVGQPLGLLSSWGSFALWHHIFIEHCAYQEGIKSFRDYTVLGDDVVIWNRAVAVAYQRNLKILGIPINLEKSVVGQAPRSPIEYAKRIAVDGTEISGISYHLLNKNSMRSIPELIEEVNKRSMIDKTARTHFGRIHSLKSRNDIAKFIIWFKLDLSPNLKEGLLNFPVTRETLSERIKEIRADKIMAKLSDLDKLFSQQCIEELFKIHEVHYEPEALGSSGLSHSEALHPLVWVVNHQGETLTDVLQLVYGGEPDSIKDVEYCPTIPNREFFYDSQSGKHEYFSSVLVDCYKELLQNTGDTG